MPRGITNKKNVSGAGTIRKKTVQRRGKAYIYWEARYTVGFDSGTGKQIQRSVTGKTQKEVSQKLRQVTTDIDQGIYIEPCKMTVREWMDTWAEIYLGGVKPRTAEIYKKRHSPLYQTGSWRHSSGCLEYPYHPAILQRSHG